MFAKQFIHIFANELQVINHLISDIYSRLSIQYTGFRSKLGSH